MLRGLDSRRQVTKIGAEEEDLRGMEKKRQSPLKDDGGKGGDSSLGWGGEGGDIHLAVYSWERGDGLVRRIKKSGGPSQGRGAPNQPSCLLRSSGIRDDEERVQRTLREKESRRNAVVLCRDRREEVTRL